MHNSVETVECVGDAKWLLHCRGRKGQSFEFVCK